MDGARVSGTWDGFGVEFKVKYVSERKNGFLTSKSRFDPPSLGCLFMGGGLKKIPTILRVMGVGKLPGRSPPISSAWEIFRY